MVFQVYRPKAFQSLPKDSKDKKGELFTCTSQSKGSKKSRNEVKAQSMESKLSQKSSAHHQGICRLIPGSEEESKAQKYAFGGPNPKFF